MAFQKKRRVRALIWTKEQNQRKTGGGGTQGGGGTSMKPLPKNGFGPRPYYDTFPPPPLCSRPVIFLGERAQTRQIPLSEASKPVLEGALYSTFFPPKIARYVLPPPLRIPKHRRREITSTSTDRQERSRNLAPVLVIIAGKKNVAEI